MKTDHIIIVNLHISIPQLKKSGLSIEEPLATVVATAASLRNNFYDHSVPWKENGDRLLTTWVFPDFYAEHRRICILLSDQRKAFMEAYLAAVDQLEFRLVEDFKPADFPGSQEIAAKFMLKLNMDRVSQALRPGDQASEENVVETFEDQLGYRFQEAETALREKLVKPLEVFIDGFSRPKNFYESQLVSLVRTADIVRKLNFSPDTGLTETCEMIAADIGAMGIKELRTNEGARGATVASARRILHNLA